MYFVASDKSDGHWEYLKEEEPCVSTVYILCAVVGVVVLTGEILYLIRKWK